MRIAQIQQVLPPTPQLQVSFLLLLLCYSILEKILASLSFHS